MKAFDYAAPRDEQGVLSVLSNVPGETEILAGGTDLVGLLKKMIVTPDRVVNIKEVSTLRGIQATSAGVTIGAVTNLDDLLTAPELAPYAALLEAIRCMNSLQLQAQGTIGGDLCARPQCWYFRNGFGLLRAADLVEQGENRFHAIFANDGLARFVSASRLAPALIALGAQVRAIGPGPEDELLLPAEALFRTPRHERERETILAPGQLLTHVHLPSFDGRVSGHYEVRHGAGADMPLVAASAGLRIVDGIVSEASIVLGQVAPTPWISREAQRALIGQPVTHETAAAAGAAAVAVATPLSDNGYKVDMARVAVKRAILLAAGLETGGF